jgi:hypothetical protein
MVGTVNLGGSVVATGEGLVGAGVFVSTDGRVWASVVGATLSVTGVAGVGMSSIVVGVWGAASADGAVGGSTGFSCAVGAAGTADGFSFDDPHETKTNIEKDTAKTFPISCFGSPIVFWTLLNPLVEFYTPFSFFQERCYLIFLIPPEQKMYTTKRFNGLGKP